MTVLTGTNDAHFKTHDTVLDAAWYGSHGTPHQVLADLRENHPVWRYEGGVVDPFWLVTRHEDVATISRDNVQWLSGPRTTLQRKRGHPAQILSLPQMDPPLHGQHRKVIQAWLSPRRIKHLEDRMRDVSRELLDKLPKEGVVDMVSSLAAPHPLRMICELLGLPETEEDQILRLSKSLFAPQDPDGSAGRDYAMTIDELLDYCRSVVDRKRIERSDDLVSAILDAEVDGAAIDDHIVLSHVLVLISAGHDTTASAISGGIRALIDNPEQLAILQCNPGLIPQAVEEIVRYITPTTSFVRTAVHDCELHGKTIAAGDDVCLHYAAANRDPRVFADPDRFNIERRPNPHLGFGMGPHVCVGQVLAKVEIAALLRELLPRLQHWEHAGQPRWMQAFWISALKSLPVRFRMA